MRHDEIPRGPEPRSGPVRVRSAAKDEHELRGTGEAEGPEKHGFKHTEDGSVRTCNQAERQHCGKREGRLAAEPAQAITEILHKVFEPAEDMRISGLFDSPGKISKSKAGFTFGLRERQTPGPEILRLSFRCASGAHLRDRYPDCDSAASGASSATAFHSPPLGTNARTLDTARVSWLHRRSSSAS